MTCENSPTNVLNPVWFLHIHINVLFNLHREWKWLRKYVKHQIVFMWNHGKMSPKIILNWANLIGVSVFHFKWEHGQLEYRKNSLYYNFDVDRSISPQLLVPGKVSLTLLNTFWRRCEMKTMKCCRRERKQKQLSETRLRFSSWCQIFLTLFA